MATVRLDTLRARMLRHADLDDSAFISPDEARDFLNDSAGHLYDKLVTLWEDYYVTTAALTLTGTSVALPSDFYKLLAVDVPGSDGKWHGLKPYSHAERNRYRNESSGRPEDVRYHLRGLGTLQLFPGYPSAVQGELRYIPALPPLVADADTVDFLGWEEWVVLHAAMKCKVKAEMDTSGLEKLLALQEQRIQQAAPQRDAGEAFVFRDTRSTSEEW